MAKIAYVRVSTMDQNTARQVAMMPADVEKVFEEKASGKSADRPQLRACIDFLRAGDVLYTESISRFARNTKDLLDLVEKLNAKGVGYISLKEQIDTTTPQGRFVLTVFGALAELEREQIRERQREGIAIAKAEGKYKGRQPIRINDKEWARVYDAWKRGEITARKAQERLGVSSNTFYRRAKEYENK